jgi:hypothetical protein
VAVGSGRKRQRQWQLAVAVAVKTLSLVGVLCEKKICLRNYQKIKKPSLPKLKDWAFQYSGDYLNRISFLVAVKSPAVSL